MIRLTSARIVSYVLVAVMAFQAALGLMFYGEYRDADWIVATWWGNDWVTLVLAVPLLVIALLWSKKESHRSTLLWMGMLAYAVYNYAYYMLGAALNRFFLLYVGCFVLAAAVLILVLARIDVDAIARRFSEHTPARAIGGYLIFIAVGLSAVWIGTWAAYAFAGKPTPVATEAFKLVAALDLALMVPLLAAGGYLLFKRKAWGYIIGTFVGIQAALYLLVLSVNSAVAIERGLVAAPGELSIWGPLLVCTTVATLWLFFSARNEEDKT